MDVLKTECQFTRDGDNELLRQSRPRVFEVHRRFHQCVDTTTTGILADDPELIMHRSCLFDDVDIGTRFAVSQLLKDVDFLECL